MKRFVALASCAAMMLSMVPMMPAQAASVCKIDTSTEYQVIRGFGGMNHPEWQSYNGGGDMKDNEIQKAFGNGDGELGLTVLRIFVSDDSNAWKNVLHTAKGAQKLGATVFATPWNPPASIRHNGSGGAKGGKYVLNNGAEEAYAKHLNSFVKYVEGQGIKLHHISVQNEPDYAEDWTAWDPDRAANFIANYGPMIKSGTNAKLMSPESFQYSPEAWGNGKKYYRAILNNSKAFQNTDLFGTHFYGTTRDQMDFPDLEKCGKEIWMTEVYVPNSNANSANDWPDSIKVAENIHNGLVVGNMSAYVWWYIRRSYSLLDESGNVTKRGAMMAQYSKWVRPGAVRIGATEQPESKTLVSAYRNTDDTIAIVAINMGDGDYVQDFQLSSGEKITSIERHRTSKTENFAGTASPDFDGSKFSALLPAKSVSTFLIDTNGSAEPQIDSDGYYFHDKFEADTCDWTARGDAEVGLSGRTAYEGSESLLAQNRQKAWNGMMKELNKRTFKAGNAYSFSVNAAYMDGDNAAETISFKLQYKGSDGETHYDTIAEDTTAKGHFIQLANQNYKIPDGATDLYLYVETPENLINIYIDDAIGAPAGTAIKGAEKVEPTEPPTEAPTEAPTEPPTEAPTQAPTEQPTEAPTQAPTEQPTEAPTQAPTEQITVDMYGDVNGDGAVDIMDVILLNKYLLGGSELGEKAKASADVDRNEKLDSTDSLNILKYIVELVSSLPI